MKPCRAKRTGCPSFEIVVEGVTMAWSETCCACRGASKIVAARANPVVVRIPIRRPCRRKTDNVTFLTQGFLLLARCMLFPPNVDPASSLKEGRCGVYLNDCEKVLRCHPQPSGGLAKAKQPRSRTTPT